QVSLSTGNSFTTSTWADFSTDSGWLSQVVGDFNNDGRDDIANFHPSNGTWWTTLSTGSSFDTRLWGTIVLEQSRSGILERLDDVDAFSFTTTGGPITIAADRDTPSGVDLKLEVYHQTGALLFAKDGATNDQQITVDLPFGTYYILVSSHGDYGDVGAY